MKSKFTVIFFFLFLGYSYAQQRDSIKAINSVSTGVKAVKPDNPIKSINKFNALLSAKPKISNLIVINKFLLDSLLKPYYNINIDALDKDTAFVPKYRMVLNDITKDTMYVTIPKEKDFLTTKVKYVFDTLKIVNPIDYVNFNKTKIAAKPVWWSKSNKFGLILSQAAFLNWNAGGQNSVAGVTNGEFIRKYHKLHLLWNNEIFLRYGVNYQDDKGLRKTDDKIQINSTFGYRKDTISNWYYTVKFNFRTQFTDGFKYPDTDNPISRFFAPAYLFFGAGGQYNLKKQKFNLYISPLTVKSTFVLDDALSADGAFGVTPGKYARNEVGILVESSWDKDLSKVINMKNRLGLYSDYLNDFGNIDVAWELNFYFVINKHFKANFGGNLLYDNDIKYKEDTNGDGQLETFGARVQLKQQLGIGVIFDF